MQYKTAWFVLRSLRECCEIQAIQLSGVVEVDERYIGGKERNKHTNRKTNAGRGAVGKKPVVGAKQRNGRVEAKVVENADGCRGFY